MKLNRLQRNLLSTSIERWLNDLELERLFTAANIPKSEFNLSSGSMRVLADEVIDWLDMNDEYCQIFLGKIINLYPHKGTLINSVNDILGKIGGSDFGEDILMDGRHPFINRSKLRQIVREMADPNGTRILEVFGPKSSGKSYSLRYFRYLEFCGWNRLKVVSIDLNSELNFTLSPYELACMLKQELGLGCDIPQQRPEQTEARWLIDVINLITREIRRIYDSEPQFNSIWIVLDGFNNPLVPRSTHEFIFLFAERVDLDLKRARLILLDCPKLLRLSIVLREDLQYLENPDLEEFFKGFVEKYHAGLSSKDSIASTLYEKMVERLPATPVERMIELGKYLPQVIMPMLSAR